MRLNRSLSLILTLTLAGVLLGGCGKESSSSSGSNSQASAGKKKLYWIQALRGHPVHQLTQIAFRDGAKKAGFEPEIIGTDGPDIGGTIALGEQVLARGDAAGIAIWTGNPAYNPFIETAGKAGVPVILPHFPVPEGSVPGATGVISCDPAEYATNAAIEIGKAIGGKGTVALSQGSFNTTENLVSETFTRVMKEHYPEVKVLKPFEEGFDAPTAIARAVGLLQGNPDTVAAFSSTGGGPVTWANACKEVSRKLVIVGMDYTRVNLDLVKSGDVFAVIGQPLWEEASGAAELLAKASKGEKIPWWTKLKAPFITKDKLDPYYALLNTVEKSLHSD